MEFQEQTVQFNLEQIGLTRFKRRIKLGASFISPPSISKKLEEDMAHFGLTIALSSLYLSLNLRPNLIFSLVIGTTKVTR